MAETLTIRTSTSTDVIKVVEQGPQGPAGAPGAGLSTLTTKGDTLYRGETTGERLPIGTTGQVLKVSAQGLPTWANDIGNEPTFLNVTLSEGQSTTTLHADGITFQNPSDAANYRNSLGLGSAAVENTTAFAAAQHAAEHEPGEGDTIQATAALVTTDVAALNGIYFSDDTSTNGKLNFFRTGTRKNTKLQYNSSTLRWELIRNLTVEAQSGANNSSAPWGQNWSDPRTPAQVTSITVARVALETMVQKLAETGSTATATTSEDGLMSSSDKTKLNGIAAGAEVNVQANWTESNSANDAFILNKPAAFAPTAHAASHASAGSDPLAPSDIGAQSIFTTELLAVTADQTLTAARAKNYAVQNYGSGPFNLTLPIANNLAGDVVVIRIGGTFVSDVVIRRQNYGSQGGGPQFTTLATLVGGGPSDQQYRFIKADSNDFAGWSLVPVDTHTHAASDITSGTLDIARLPTGTSSTQVALGNHTHTPSEVGLGNVSNTAQVTSVTGTAPIVSSGGTTPVISVTTGTTAGTVAAGDDSRITGAAQKSANLSDLTSASTARTNLGLGTAATAATSDFAAASHAHPASAISDSTTAGRALLTAADAAAQRTSLGLGTLATQSGTFSGTSSGTNTGDQTISLTGDVTGSGTGSFAATIANNAVTNAKLAQVATSTIKGRATAATGNVEDLTAAQVRTILNVADGATANSSDATLLNRANHTGTQAHTTITGLGGAATLSVGATSGTVAAGDDSRFHTRSHAMTGTSDHTASNWSVFYSNGNGQVTELALGAANTVLTSNGASSAPSFAAAASGGTKTYAVFTAEHNQPPSTAFATLDTRNSIAVLDFDDATTESAVFVGVMPEAASLGSGLIVRIHFMATTATSGNVRWSVSFERGNTDLDADSFDAATAATTATSSTSGIPAVSAITCTSIDGITASDPYRLRIQRLGADAADSMSGDAEILAVEVRSAA